MTPEERVANLDIVCGECNEYHCLCLNCAAQIAQALREHGNERLEEAAVMADEENKYPQHQQSNAAGFAAAIRALKDEEKP